MSISVGMVGLGMFGRSFVWLYKNHPDVQRLALCDLRQDRLDEMSKKYGIDETYHTLDEICKSDLDALVIITQPWLHARQAMQAMKAGKHVYSAVPAAYRLEDCGPLVKTVEKTGMIYMNGETSFFRAEAVYCRKRAAEGAFGNFVYSQAEYFHDMSHGLYDVAKNRWGEQFGPDKMGEIPMHYPTHSTCYMISVTGAHMTHVSAQGYVHPNDDWYRLDTIWKNPFSNEVALFRMSDGSSARVCEFRRVGHVGGERTSGIYGTEGSFEHNLAGSVWTDTRGKQAVDPPTKHEYLPEPLASNLGGHGGSHAYLVHEFVDSVNRQRLPRINVWEAVRYCVPGFIAHKSALAGGRLLKIPDWGDARER